MAVATVILPLAAIGCSRPADLGEVAGTVTLDGKPLARGRLALECPGHRPASARIEDGRILEVTTYRPGDGAAIGRHRIAVFARDEPAPAVVESPGQSRFNPASMVGHSMLPARYNHPDTSGLSATIKPGQNTLSLALTTDPP